MVECNFLASGLTLKVLALPFMYHLVRWAFFNVFVHWYFFSLPFIEQYHFMTRFLVLCCMLWCVFSFPNFHATVLLYLPRPFFYIDYTLIPSKNICTSSFISVCRDALGISVTSMYLFSFATMAQESIKASSDIVGELASDFVVYSLCEFRQHNLWLWLCHHDFLLDHLVLKGSFPMLYLEVFFVAVVKLLK